MRSNEDCFGAMGHVLNMTKDLNKHGTYLAVDRELTRCCCQAVMTIPALVEMNEVASTHSKKQNLGSDQSSVLLKTCPKTRRSYPRYHKGVVIALPRYIRNFPRD